MPRIIKKAFFLIYILTCGLHTARAETASYYIGGSFDTYLNVIEGTQTATNFYQEMRSSNSPDNAFTTEAGAAHLFLYQQTGTSFLSLGIITNGRRAPGGTSGQLDGTISGLGSSAYVAIADDNAREFSMTSAGSGTVVMDFRWIASYSDGGVISGLDPTTLNPVLDITRSLGLTNFALVGDNNNGGFGFKRYSIPASGTLSFAVAAAPEPGTWALMILGFILVASRLKQKRSAGWRPIYSIQEPVTARFA